jgi:hypothetical protein
VIVGDFSLDFVGIGAAKAGTTWLAACLSEHPQICMSDPKEVNFFCEKHTWPTTPTNYDKGEEWLRQRFSHYEPEQIRGEFSVCYLVDPVSPSLLHRHFPNTKIIVSFRNPTEGLYSFYYSVSKRYAVPNSFGKFLQEYPDFMDYGRYYEKLLRYMNYFPKEKIHIILYDDIQKQPRIVLKNLFSFLDVEDNFEPHTLSTRRNQRQGVHSIALRNAVGKTVDFFRTNPNVAGATKLARRLGADRVVDWIQQINLEDQEFPPMDGSIRQKLVAYYAPGNSKLADLIGRDLRSWNSVETKP